MPDDPATMLLLYQSWGDVGPETPLLVVLSDGRVVARFWHEGGSGFLATRRLTAAAMEQVRAELVVVGLFDRDRERQMIEPWPAGGAGDELQVRLSDKTVTVRRNLAPADYYEPSQAWDRFDALVDKLRAPDRWLAEELWADTRWTPYHARAFCLRIDSRQGGQPTLDSMELDVRGPILPLGSFGAPGIGTDQRTRFGSVSSADIYRFAAAVADLANAHAIPDLRDERIPLDAGAAFVLFPTLREAGVDWLVYVEALMPQQTCADE